MKRILEWEEFGHVNEWLSPTEMSAIEEVANRLFAGNEFGIRITRHFKDQANLDNRNGEPISKKDILEVISKILDQAKGEILKMKENEEAVIFDTKTNINVPIIYQYNPRKDKMEVVLKTIMRKKNYTSTNAKMALESLIINI